MVDKMKPFGERRLFERKACSRMIMIDDQAESYSGHMRDLAVGGAFVESTHDNDARIGQELVLTIPFGLKKDHVKIKAKVAWIKHMGMGVRFIKSSPDGRRLK